MKTKKFRMLPLLITVILLLTAAVWFFFLPKRPFFLMPAEYVVRVDRCWIHGSYWEFEQIGGTEEAVQCGEALRQMTLTRWMSFEDTQEYAGGPTPLRITLKNGKQFAIHVGPYVILYQLENGKSNGWIAFWLSEDKQTQPVFRTFYKLRNPEAEI